MLKHSTFFNNENRADWLKVFNDLTERGVKRVMIIVSDDFPGIANAIEKFFSRYRPSIVLHTSSEKCDSSDE